jgi:hypothetical protein
MLADVSLLLHEINDAVRSRRGLRASRAVTHRPLARPTTVYVTGLASGGKARLIARLAERLAAVDIAVHAGYPSSSDLNALHVHAETDIEALIEGGLKTAAVRDAARADLVVPVDWEPPDRSVSRVIDALVERGLADAEGV